MSVHLNTITCDCCGRRMQSPGRTALMVRKTASLSGWSSYSPPSERFGWTDFCGTACGTGVCGHSRRTRKVS